MLKGHSFCLKTERNRLLILLFTIAACVALAFYVGFIRGEEVVYTHFFYIPVILAGMWYYRKAAYVALGLSVVHILVTYFSPQFVTLDNVTRCAILTGVAYIIGFINEKYAEGEQALRVSEKQLDQIFNTAGSGMRVVDRDFNGLRINETFSSLSGVNKDEAVGKKCYEVFPGPLCHTDSCPLTRILGGEECVECEVEKERNNGTRIPCILTATPLRGPGGELIGIVEDFKDITDRKQAEESLRRFSKELELEVEERTKELKKERDYTRHLIESSPDFQMTLDRKGRIMDVNEEFEKIISKSRIDLIGKSVYEYFSREETEKVIAEIFDKKQVRDIELTTNIPKRGTLTFNLSGTVFTTPGGELGIYASGRDVTEVKRLQEEKLKAKDIQLIHAARLSTLGEMATAMAHEINQPLNIISITAEGISRDIKKNRLDMICFPQDIDDILNNVKRIDRIITHMRTFARQPEVLESAEPEKLLNNTFVMLGEQFRVHNISISRKTEKNLPVIKVDPNQLEQVFLNILINARQVLDEKGDKATAEGESFQKQLKCRIFRENDYVVFEFSDNAYGVPDEIKMRLFEPFFTKS